MNRLEPDIEAAVQELERLIGGLCAEDVDNFLRDTREYPDPNDPRIDQRLKDACLRRLAELGG